MTKDEYHARLLKLIACDDWWPDPLLMSGSAHAVSGDRPDAQPVILVPDGDGGYREHAVTKAKRRMGF